MTAAGGVIGPLTPQEPPVGTVVIDDDCDAWQRIPTLETGEDAWASSCDPYARSWVYVLTAHGPVTVVYVPEGH